MVDIDNLVKTPIINSPGTTDPHLTTMEAVNENFRHVPGTGRFTPVGLDFMWSGSHQGIRTPGYHLTPDHYLRGTGDLQRNSSPLRDAERQLR